MPKTYVQARDIVRSFEAGERSVRALEPATFNVEEGARIAVVGPSGSGKSTLLHLIAGLDTPTSGEIAWPALGERSTLRPRHVVVIFQAPSLVSSFTALENIELPLLMLRVPADEARVRALAALRVFGLDGLAAKLPDEISGGQAQRVAMARALALRPALIVADEPTGQLDRATADALLSQLLDALSKTSAALLVATHDPLVARRLGAQWRMNHGRLTAA